MPHGRGPGTPTWVGLSEASSLLGVSPATLRRWSDAGRVKAFFTPGGHRRFSRAALERLLPTDRVSRPSLGLVGLSPDRLTRVYRRRARRQASDGPWLTALDDASRAELRERGRHLAAALIQYLDAEGDEAQEEWLAAAEEDAAAYGRAAAALGLSLSDTVQGFLQFRAPFFGELAATARRRGFDATEATELLQQAERAMDRLLVASMATHGNASHPDDQRRRPA